MRFRHLPKSTLSHAHAKRVFLREINSQAVRTRITGTEVFKKVHKNQSLDCNRGVL